MATLADLRDRIIREVNREELTEAPSSDLTAANSDTLDQCIARAIDFYADERFSFNEATLMVDTVVGGNLVEYPGNLRKIDRISIDANGNRYALRVQDYTTLDEWQGWDSVSGQPTDYAVTTGFINIYPTPNVEYPITIIGIIDTPIDFTDTAFSNGWTTEAQDLIVARTKMLLQRDYFNNDAEAAKAIQAEDQALRRLRGGVVKRVATGRVRGSW